MNDRVPPNQTVTQKWPVLHYGPVPVVNRDRWRLRIFGLVRPERELTWDEFAALPRRTVTADFHCVTGWSRLQNRWTGVLTREVLRLVEVSPLARYVMVYGENHFSANLPVDAFLDEDVLFACLHDGEPLTPEHGGPVRLVVPRLYAWKSAKWVTGIELMAKDRPGFWERAGYHMRGDPWKEERYGGE